MNIHLLKNKRLKKTNIFYSSENKARWDLTAQDNSVPEGPPPSCRHQMVEGVMMEEKGWETCDACALESDRG